MNDTTKRKNTNGIHSGRFAEVSESDAEKLIEKMQTLKTKTFYDEYFISIYKISRKLP